MLSQVTMAATSSGSPKRAIGILDSMNWMCSGVIDEKLAAKYPYQRAYLPVNRLQHDGTLWNW